MGHQLRPTRRLSTPLALTSPRNGRKYVFNLDFQYLSLIDPTVSIFQVS